MNKSKLIWGGIVAIALIFAGFLWYSTYKAKNKLLQGGENGAEISSFEDAINGDDILAIDEENLDEEMENFNAQCEAGEWLKIADQSGSQTTVSGKLRRVYPDDEAAKQFSGYSYFIEGPESIALAGSNLAKLDYFEDREVEVQGVKNSEKKELAVAQVKCTGAETNKNVLDERRKLMDYVAANINSIASKKAKYQKWAADIIEFVDESHAYVEYYDAVEDDENSDVDEDTARKILVEAAAKAGGGYDLKVLAYWEMGEDDYILKEGSDKYEDVGDTNSYQYDPEKNKWERID
ncbi:MAG: hypothetical protein COZ28_00745 [Candidatus Moranbacteria bacterium CG_4_10_14_3_um_filter_44_15]|nr:MAG: hypothetical protein COS72_04550 [Candidatus Moranbacteria bacterium CG06_land_8_20_14_3_00_43_56]PIX91052.1 MAG: hypothetical protein COZ28_00745 [Candidatus Moranbacteria bacterium CG_4_10_14_3_um_filter_44_15]PJA85693.1 MAG: hypothetical protein CO142_03020 [Candidatus Moranbacteria bacterium CG_4_9_14_3_um_filter_44_28]